jgi:transposase InsO family protein
MTDAQLRKVWLDAGRPGIARFRAVAQRAGYPIKLAEARQFIQSQETRQIFAPTPASKGHVTAARLDDKWQADLIDFKQANAKENEGNRVVLIVTDVLSRYTWAEPLADKAAETVAKAFEAIMRKTGRKPAEVDSDGGNEFGRVFDEMLERHGIAHRTKRPGHTNALAVVDTSIRRFKEILRQELAAGGGGWAKHLAKAVAGLNNSPNDYLMGSNPADVKGNSELQLALQEQAGRDMTTNARQHADRMAALRIAGAFRTRLPERTFTRATTARWSNDVHKVASFIGDQVVDDKGARFPVRDVLPVKLGSKDVAAASDIGTDAKQREQREKMRPFALALSGMLGAEGLSMQGAGTKLRKLPGFTERMEEVRLTGIGALERLVRLYPASFEVEGEGQRKRIKRA